MKACRARCIAQQSFARLQHGSRINLSTFNKSVKLTVPRACFSTRKLTSSPDALNQDHIENFDFAPSNFDAYANLDAPLDPEIKYFGKEHRGLLSAFKDLQTKELLLQLDNLDSLDSVLRDIVHMIMTNGYALEPDHYTHCIHVLYKHAGFLPGTRKHSLDPDQIDNFCNVLMVVWGSSVALGEWQLSMHTYGCLIYMLAHFNHPGAFEIFYALQKIDTVILDDATCGSLMAMAYRVQEYDRVIDMWQEMNKRYGILRQTFNKSEYTLQSEWQWTDEKQREFHYLMANVPCQQMWMYHCALQAAEKLRRTRTTSSILAALFRWEEAYAIAQQKIRDPALIEFNDGSSILNDSLLSNRLVVQPVRTAVTYHLMLVHFSQAKDCTSLLQTLGQMEQQDIKLTKETAIPVVTLLASAQQFESLYAFLCYAEHKHDLLEPAVIAPAISLMMKREHFEREHLGVRFADSSRQHIVRILDAFFQRCAHNGRAQILTRSSDDSNLMIIQAKGRAEEKPRDMLFLALLKASLMSESLESKINLWIDTEDYTSMGVILATLTTLGARAIKIEACEPYVIECLKSLVPTHSQHIVYITPAQVHAFRTKLLQSFSSEPHLDRTTLQFHLQSCVSSRYHSFWMDLAQSPPHTLPPMFNDFVKIWSLHTSSTMLMKNIASSSPYAVQHRLGFVNARTSAINNAVSSLCSRKVLYLPPHITVDFHQAVDPNAPQLEGSLLNITGQSVSSAYAAIYIFLEFVAHLVQTGVDRCGALYLRSGSLAQLEEVRMLLERHTTLTPLYLLRPTPAELRDAGSTTIQDDSHSVPVTTTARLVQGHPSRFRKLTRAMGLKTTDQKHDLKYVLLVPGEQLEKQDRAIAVDHVHMALDIAKQFDREQSTLSAAGQAVNGISPHSNQKTQQR